MPARTKVALVCDSTICLPSDMVEQLGLHIVPIELTIDDKTYLDGVDLSTEEFYLLLARCEKLPTTSAPSPASFIRAFTAGAESGENILCLNLSSTISATYDVAVAAAGMCREILPGVNIEVMDTLTAAGGEGLVVLAAAMEAAADADMAQVKAAALRVMSQVNLIAFLDTLYYLWKGGRIHKVAAWAGSILKLKPMMELYQGDVRPLERPRTRRRAIDRLLALTRQRVGDNPIRVNVMHAVAPADALDLKGRLLREFNCVEVVVSEFTPAMGTHTGPGLLGLAFHREEST